MDSVAEKIFSLLDNNFDVEKSLHTKEDYRIKLSKSVELASNDDAESISEITVFIEEGQDIVYFLEKTNNILKEKLKQLEHWPLYVIVDKNSEETYDYLMVDEYGDDGFDMLACDVCLDTLDEFKLEEVKELIKNWFFQKTGYQQ